jgi:hypothetical protein
MDHPREAGYRRWRGDWHLDVTRPGMIGERLPEVRWRRVFRSASLPWRSWVSRANGGEAGGVLAYERARPREHPEEQGGAGVPQIVKAGGWKKTAKLST